ncbi:unnamed protein product, partial [marine sediment metagenome]
MSMRENILKIARQAKDASSILAGVSAQTKNRALRAMARAMRKN